LFKAFCGGAVPAGKQARNEFVVRLQPDPAIYMKMTVGTVAECTGARLVVRHMQTCDARPSHHM
jgi:hypothetical protein